MRRSSTKHKHKVCRTQPTSIQVRSTQMRRIIIFVTLTLTSLIYVSGQPAPPSAQAQKARGRVMVKKLPVKVEGVMLKDGQVKLKPGYKFVKRPNGTVAVARISGSVGQGNNVGGTWSCGCTAAADPKEGVPPGECSVNFFPGGMNCSQGSCTGTCFLAATVEGARTNVIMY